MRAGVLYSWRRSRQSSIRSERKRKRGRSLAAEVAGWAGQSAPVWRAGPGQGGRLAPRLLVNHSLAGTGSES